MNLFFKSVGITVALGLIVVVLIQMGDYWLGIRNFTLIASIPVAMFHAIIALIMGFGFFHLCKLKV